MRNVWLISTQTVKELVRDRILWAFFASALALVLFSLLLGTLSFIEQVKITIDTGLGMIHLLALALSLFLGVSLVGRELRNRTIYSILARPLSRLEYLLGKYLGLLMIIALSSCVLLLALLGLLFLLKGEPTQSLIVAVIGINFEMAVVASFAMFLSLAVSPLVASFAAFGWWAAGSFSTDILYLSSKSEDTVVKIAGRGLYYFLPRLDLFQMKNRVVYEPSIPLEEIMQFSLYAVVTVGLLLFISLFVFQRRDL